MNLEEKSEAAFIGLLKTVKRLDGFRLVGNDDDENKDEDAIVVSAVRQEEVAGNSGVFAVMVTLSIRKRKVNGQQSSKQIRNTVETIERELMIPRLHEKLTLSTKDFHCYHAKLMPGNRQPTTNAFQQTIPFRLEAMPCTMDTARRQFARTLRTTS
jgi:hypothetical protein